jgi:hypothetical protein
MEGGKEGEKNKSLLNGYLTYLTLNFYILILITCVILTEIAKITYLMVIKRKRNNCPTLVWTHGFFALWPEFAGKSENP